MDLTAGKPSFLRNILVRLLVFGVLVILVRFAYVVTIAGETCSFNDFCFFSNEVIIAKSNARLSARNEAVIAKSNAHLPARNDAVIAKSNAGLSARNDVVKEPSREWISAVRFYSSVFQDLTAEGVLKVDSKCLCVGSAEGREAFALREIGVKSEPLIVNRGLRDWPYDDESFDFVFSGDGWFDELSKLGDVVSEIERTIKPEGFVVVHLRGGKDEYSMNSFIDLFGSCRLVKSRDIENGFDNSKLKEIVLQKMGGHEGFGGLELGRELVNKCSVPGYKRAILANAEPLIEEEPLKPWLTLKKNLRNIKYLTSMVDVSYKNRYVYVDVGARSYGSSIGSWFKKKYPKQNKTFDVYAIEADKAFHEEYKSRKGVKLLPYAAWVRNESLTFEINHDPGKEVKSRGRGMGRIQPVGLKNSENFDGDLDTIQGIDFAEWLKNTVDKRDLVVMKMDVEGTEFDLIPRLFETGAICLVNEIFLECHYNRWQRCCPGVRSPKYEKTYGQCLELFKSLREKGVLVHQWW